MAKHTITITGDTRPAASSLKAHGFRWDGRRWSRQISESEASVIAAGGVAATKALEMMHACKKGCHVMLSDGAAISEVWRSKTYAEAQQVASHADPDQDGCGWNVDAAGNPVASKQIPGSSPDDRI